MSSSKKFTLRSSDGECFEVEEAVAFQSQMIKFVVEDDCSGDEMPLPNVNAETLAKVIEYCKKHGLEASKNEDGEGSSWSSRAKREEDLKKWDAHFMNIDQKTLFDLIMAADYLEIKELLDLACQTVANMIKGKTPDEMRKKFGIKNDFTAEEEEEIRREHPWAFG